VRGWVIVFYRDFFCLVLLVFCWGGGGGGGVDLEIGLLFILNWMVTSCPESGRLLIYFQSVSGSPYVMLASNSTFIDLEAVSLSLNTEMFN